jgi:hypothetical protein
MTFNLARGTGAKLLESTIGNRRPGYMEYVQRTSGFIPLPRRSRSDHDHPIRSPRAPERAPTGPHPREGPHEPRRPGRRLRAGGRDRHPAQALRPAGERPSPRSPASRSSTPTRTRRWPR